jgi:glycosyltransferase involved in cell wall biosynthesis
VSLAPWSIWLDAQGAQNRAHFDRGTPRYVVEHLRHLLKLAPGAIAGVGLNPALPLPGNLDWCVGTGKLRWGVDRPPAPPLPRVYHVMSPMELDRDLDELWPRWARRDGVRTVVTLFDLIPLVFADFYLRDPDYRSRYLARLELVRSADHVLTLSDATAGDAHERLGIPRERLTVIDAGVADSVAGWDDGDAWPVLRRRFPEIGDGFLLYVAGIEFRKNLERLIEAYGLTTQAFRRGHQLVITCRLLPEQRDHLLECSRRAGLEEGRLVLTGYVTDAELSALYRACTLFVFASFYEGLGLPMLEAMAHGAPVSAADASTSQEILDDRDGLFDPYDPSDMARIIEATATDAPQLERLRVRSRRRASRYTWQHVVERTLEGYERALQGPSRRRRPRRRRIALFTPWPPDRSGIAKYNQRLLPELSRFVDVDVVVAGAPAEYDEPRLSRVQTVAAGDMKWLDPLRVYDRVVYCMGNADVHAHVYEALRLRSGAVIAHDVRLTGFYGAYAGRERPQDPLSRLHERLDAMYGSRLGRDAFAERPPTPEEQAALGIYMTQEVQEHADLVLVHSAYAAELMRLDRGPRTCLPEPVVVPFGVPGGERTAVRHTDPAAPLIVSFGVVSAVKDPETLIEATALLARDRPGARVVFAGDADDAGLDVWRAVAAEAGVGDRVELPGHVSDDAWECLVNEADVAVQLRPVSNGEASAAVAECLGSQVPVVVTDLGWAAELPGEAVEKVPPRVTGPALAEAIARILDDPGRRAGMAAAARAHAKANSFAAVARRYVEVLELS